MVVIPLAGNASRFFDAGYTQFKFLLPLGDKTIIERIVSYIPEKTRILFILRRDHEILPVVKELFANRINIECVEVEKTRGQLETVMSGLSKVKIDNTEQIIVYNGDTIRKLSFDFDERSDIWLEVFHGEGTHWSFVDKLGDVNRITEKNRISTLCSNGLYSLGPWAVLSEYYSQYRPDGDIELYIAPFMNFLISQKIKVKAYLCEEADLIFAGTPAEYEKAKLNF